MICSSSSSNNNNNYKKGLAENRDFTLKERRKKKSFSETLDALLQKRLSLTPRKLVGQLNVTHTCVSSNSLKRVLDPSRISSKEHDNSVLLGGESI